MLAKFMEGLEGKLAEQWTASLFTPAFVVWAACFGLWVHRFGWTKFLQEFGALSSAIQIIISVAGLIVISLSALIVQHLEFPTLRLLEGYWPQWPLVKTIREKLVKRKVERFADLRLRFGPLKAREISGAVSLDERGELAELELKLHHVPEQDEQCMPTRFGNILRAAEVRPGSYYGLDTIVCWPCLWLILPSDAKKDIGEARADLDSGVRVFVWSILFLVAGFFAWNWWVLAIIVAVSVIGVSYAYWSMMIGAAEVYGTLLESTFSVYRWSLYKSMRWPEPEKPADEKAIGQALTAYIWRGLYPADQPFTEAEAKPPVPPSPNRIVVNAPDIVTELRRMKKLR